MASTQNSTADFPVSKIDKYFFPFLQFVFFVFSREHFLIRNVVFTLGKKRLHFINSKWLFKSQHGRLFILKFRQMISVTQHNPSLSTSGEITAAWLLSIPDVRWAPPPPRNVSFLMQLLIKIDLGGLKFLNSCTSISIFVPSTLPRSTCYSSGPNSSKFGPSCP